MEPCSSNNVVVDEQWEPSNTHHYRTLQRADDAWAELWEGIAILTVYKQVFFNLNFANHRTKESFVLTANKPLVGTLIIIGDVTVSITMFTRAGLFESRLTLTQG